MEQSPIEILGIAALFALAIREFFVYIKSRNSNTADDFGKRIFEELKLMNGNHLHSIENAINDGNAQLIHSMHEDNMKIIEALGEIKGNLKK